MSRSSSGPRGRGVGYCTSEIKASMCSRFPMDSRALGETVARVRERHSNYTITHTHLCAGHSAEASAQQELRHLLRAVG